LTGHSRFQKDLGRFGVDVGLKKTVLKIEALGFPTRLTPAVQVMPAISTKAKGGISLGLKHPLKLRSVRVVCG